MADTSVRQLRSFLGTAGRVHLYQLLAAYLEAGYSVEETFQRLANIEAKTEDKDGGLVEAAKQVAEIQKKVPGIPLGEVLGRVLSPTSQERMLYQIMGSRQDQATDSAMLVRLLDRAAAMTV